MYGIIKLIAVGLGLYNILKTAGNDVSSKISHKWDRVKLSDIKLFQEKISLRVRVTNQNEFPIPIKSLFLKVNHSGMPIGVVNSDSLVPIQANETQLLALTFRFEGQNIFNYISSLLTKEISLLAPIQITGHMTAIIKDREVTIPYNDQISFVQ
jgi:LEA14-like dessication related protein